MKKIFAILFLSTAATGYAQSFFNMPVDNNGGAGTRFVTCSGSFNDSGQQNNYGNNENGLATFCPGISTDRMQLNFLQMNILTGDVLTIYDGQNATAPVLGAITNTTTAPGLFQASATNPTGCLTVRFTSNGTGNAGGWRALIACFNPCQTITPTIVTAPATDADNILRICQNEQVTFNGTATFSVDGAGATYEWNLGNGGGTVMGQTQTETYITPGVYFVRYTVTDASGCFDRQLIDLTIQVSTDPNFSGTVAQDTLLCFGESTTITGRVVPQQFALSPSPPIAGTTFLPDGSGVSYQTCVSVDLFAPGATVTNASDLVNIFVNMEHSFLGDLDISITAPNGATVALHNYPSGGGTFLGQPIDDDTNLNPGVGFDYVFTEGPSATRTWAQWVAQVGGTTIPAGNYRPVDPYSRFVGSPLNGQWCINITDNLRSDNGFIFRWGLNFNPAIIPPALSFTPGIASQGWLADPSITNTAGNIITVQPAASGLHCYVFQFIDTFGCPYTEQVCITMQPEITSVNPPDIALCSLPGSGTNVFNLTQDEATTLNGLDPALYTVRYHNTLASAAAGSNAITNAANYTASSNPETIFVSVSDNATLCIVTHSFVISSIDFGTINIQDYEQCGDIVNFDLPAYVAPFLTALGGGSGTSGFTLSFYASLVDAQLPANELLNPMGFNATTAVTTLYLRIVSSSDATCFTIQPFDLTAFIIPSAAQPADLVLCDETTDGTLVADFSLRSQTAAILNGQSNTDFVVTYHSSQADADANTGGLNPNAYANTARVQTVFARVENVSEPLCFSTITFNIQVDPQARFNTVSDLSLCDDFLNDGAEPFNLAAQTATILGSQDPALFTVTYHETAANAAANTGSITNTGAYLNTANPQTIHVRVTPVANASCFAAGTFDLNVNEQAVANSITPLVQCDDASNDGIATFDLTVAGAQVLGTQDPAVFTASMHTSQANADANAAAINISAFNNATRTQTIYVRVENTLAPDCFATTSFTIQVDAQASFNVVSDLSLCDDFLNDGAEPFNLAAQTATILGSQDPALFTVTYHETAANAAANTGSITNTGAYLNTANPQIIHVRVTPVANASCFATGTFELIVNEQAIANPVTPLVQCDDASNDGIATFDLTVASAQVLGTQDPAVFTVSMHTSQANADANAAAINISAFNNVTRTQTIFMRVENTLAPDCFATTSFTIQVDAQASFNVVSNLSLCDDFLNDGAEPFNLAAQTATILGSQDPALFTVTYHETAANAAANTGEITNTAAYLNIANPQTIHVRMTPVANASCFAAGTFELIVNEQAIANPVTALVQCDDASNDGVAIFDLTAAIAQVLGAQDPAFFTVTVHISQTDAGANANPVAIAFTNTTAPQTLIARIANNANTNCYQTTAINLILNEAPRIAMPAAIVQCDDLSGDGVEVFNLALNEAALLNGLNSIDYTITYHSNQGDAIAGTAALPVSYTNTVLSETIFVRVVNNVTSCVNTTSFNVVVNPIPLITVVSPIEECDDDLDGIATFALRGRTTAIINGQSNHVVLFYETTADAISGSNALNEIAYINTSNPQTVTYRLINNTTGCFAISDFVIEAVAAPAVTLPSPIENCEEGTGNAVADLDSSIMEIIGTQTGLQVTFHNTQGDATTGANALTTPYDYDENKTLVVRVEDMISSCVSFITLDLVFNELPQPFLFEEYIICRDNAGALLNGPAVLNARLDNATFDFIWSLNGVEVSGATQAIYNATEPGDYEVTAINRTTGCSALAFTTVRQAGAPQNYDVQVTTDSFALTHQVFATASGPDIYWFRLDEGPYVSSGRFDNVPPGPHTVTIAERNGCGEIVVDIFVFGYPDYFTPNNDGYHDTWNIIGGDLLPGTKLYIFDRFGKLIKQLDPAGAGWDGTYNGQQLPSSDYWFRIEYLFNDRVAESSGHFALKR
jgi:gliding motility-associated-like protein